MISDVAIDHDGCNLETPADAGTMSCPSCGAREPLIRATCGEASRGGASDEHGPRMTHWHCRRCNRYVTVERLASQATSS
jgi:hypothetical protein